MPAAAAADAVQPTARPHLKGKYITRQLIPGSSSGSSLALRGSSLALRGAVASRVDDLSMSGAVSKTVVAAAPPRVTLQRCIEIPRLMPRLSQHSILLFHQCEGPPLPGRQHRR